VFLLSLIPGGFRELEGKVSAVDTTGGAIASNPQLDTLFSNPLPTIKFHSHLLDDG